MYLYLFAHKNPQCHVNHDTDQSAERKKIRSNFVLSKLKLTQKRGNFSAVLHANFNFVSITRPQQKKCKFVCINMFYKHKSFFTDTQILIFRCTNIKLSNIFVYKVAKQFTTIQSDLQVQYFYDHNLRPYTIDSCVVKCILGYLGAPSLHYHQFIAVGYLGPTCLDLLCTVTNQMLDKLQRQH